MHRTTRQLVCAGDERAIVGLGTGTAIGPNLLDGAAIGPIGEMLSGLSLSAEEHSAATVYDGSCSKNAHGSSP